MADTLFFVHCDASVAQQLAEQYHVKGWTAEACEPGAPDALDRISAAQPLAVVFCLEGSHADEVRGLAESVLADERVVRPLMVFTGGQPSEVEQARALNPLGVFVRPDELHWVLKRLNFNQ